MATKKQLLESRKFKVQLNGISELHQQLEDFKKACDTHERHRRKRCKRRYYQMGLMARIVNETTDDELKRLLKNGTRTFLLDAVTNKPAELEKLLLMTNQAVQEYQEEESSIKLVTGLAIEIHGDSLRLGRIRNNCAFLLQKDDIMTLTTDESYRYSCFKEIAYVINLKYYLKKLQLSDVLIIGKEIHCKIVKKLRDSIAIVVLESGLLRSYEYIEMPKQCYLLKPQTLPELFISDLQLAQAAQAHFIVVTKVRCKQFLKTLRAQIKADSYNFKLIGTIDFEFVSSKMLDIMGILELLDYLWITDFFNEECNIQRYVFEDVVPICKCLKKPIIGSVPLERCSDFKRFENHEFLWKIDAIFIEKSPWCNKYPLIVKKLLPLRDFRMGMVENCMVLKNILTSYQSIVNFIIRTISSIECQAIIMHCKCEAATVALGRIEIYCPVLVVLPLDDEEDMECKTKLARAINLRRNLRGILYTKEMNECEQQPVEFGIWYARKTGLLDTGDFVVTLEVCKKDDENVEYGVDGDVAILRAFYLPPLKTCESYKYS